MSSSNSLLALGAFLQHQLDVVVECAEFFPGGQRRYWDGAAAETPCSLVTLDPFCPGGLRRLVLNVHAPLIHDAARALQEGQHVAAVVALGDAMIRSGSWPIQSMDASCNIYWNTTPGLIATPHCLCAWPVRHQVMLETTPTATSPAAVRRRQAQIAPLSSSTSSRIRNNVKPLYTPLAIWPRRIYKVEHAPNRSGGDASSVKRRRPAEPRFVGEVWARRDQALRLEFEQLVRNEPKRTVSLGRRFLSKLSLQLSSSHDATLTTDDLLEDNRMPAGPFVSSRAALLTYAPALPVFCVADLLVQRGLVPRHSALAQAATFLVQTDRLFALSLFFGVPLMDRTGVLNGALRVAPWARPPPTARQVKQFLNKQQQQRQQLVSSVGGCTDDCSDKKRPAHDYTGVRACHESLRLVMLQRARELWAMTETTTTPTIPAAAALSTPGFMVVAWSGGIDSTAALCALLETAREEPTIISQQQQQRHSHAVQLSRMQRIQVMLDEESMVENPGFYRNYIDGKLHQVPRNDQPLSFHERAIRQDNPSSVLVTGELGDQLFGSDRCGAAFPNANGERDELPESVTKKHGAPQIPPPEFQDVFVQKGLAAPWEETILPSMASVGLVVQHGGFASWKTWIAPQLAVAPFAIVSTHDFLWWLNFSMKWQNVSLRCLHDGGEPALLDRAHITKYNITGCIQHYYDSLDFECWSCVEQFHRFKFPDLTNWKTYKEPLKHFIHQFDSDDTFYREKTKIGSLCFGAPSEADSYVNRFHGAIVDLLPVSEQPVASRTNMSGDTSCGMGSWYSEQIDPASRPRLLTWGACGVTSSGCRTLEPLVHAETLAAIQAYPLDTMSSSESAIVYVDPWNNLDPLVPSSPIDIAPFFVKNDERQRRGFNPVTKITLTGKCAALLTTELLEGRSFLDLGACLGASCHWALCKGARHATAVEAQQSFCRRAETMLQKAQAIGCWPVLLDKVNSPRFQVVSCGIREYLATCEDASYDVVLAAGVLHCFVDPIQILVEMARVASHAVLIEMTHPAMYADGFLEDPDPIMDLHNNDWDGTSECEFHYRDGLRASVRPLQRRIEEGGLLQLARQALVNMADNDASFKGLAILPSRMAIESTMIQLGFAVTRVYLKKHPTTNEDVDTYTGPRRYRALSTRYFLRCTRKTSPSNTSALSLESLVLANDRSKSLPWVGAKSWFSFSSTDNSNGDATPVINIETQAAVNGTGRQHDAIDNIQQTAPTMVEDDPNLQWEFDAAVAARFELEARRHIPDYEEVIDDSIQLLESDLESNSLLGKQRKETIFVADIGCAVGHTLIRLLQRGFRNVHGVDVSVPMIERAKLYLKDAGYDQDAKLHLSTVATDLPESLVSATNLNNDDEQLLGAAFVNWTLQFVRLEADRKVFLRNIANRMNSGALLVLTEKTVQDTLTRKKYDYFKKEMGVTEEQVAIKEARLKGVLEPLNVRWYLDALQECGFSDVCLFRAKYGFVTFLARRNVKPLSVTAGHILGPQMNPPYQPFVTWSNVSQAANAVCYKANEVHAPFQMKAWGSISRPSIWTGGSDSGTVYGYVYSGPAELSVVVRVEAGSRTISKRSFTLYDGMYFSCPGPNVEIVGGSGVLYLVNHHKALFSIGGPVESGEGRLPYIDGCTDSLLLAPAVKGAPCLNHLHFPVGIVQTQHTHPSGRGGIIAGGKGTCVCNGSRTELVPGMAFVIPANVLHAFETAPDENLDVIAFHPDSDFGPSSNDHPMINRTMVDGISASRIDSIRTHQI